MALKNVCKFRVYFVTPKPGWQPESYADLPDSFTNATTPDGRLWSLDEAWAYVLAANELEDGESPTRWAIIVRDLRPNIVKKLAERSAS